MQGLRTKFKSVEENKFNKPTLIRLNFKRHHLEISRISQSEKSLYSSSYTFVKVRKTKNKKENNIYDFLVGVNVQQIHWDVMMRESDLKNH